jgi:hypothetical protein
MGYEFHHVAGSAPLKMWTKGVRPRSNCYLKSDELTGRLSGLTSRTWLNRLRLFRLAGRKERIAILD